MQSSSSMCSFQGRGLFSAYSQFCDTQWPWPLLFSPSWLMQWSIREGSYKTLFSPSDVTAFHRIQEWHVDLCDVMLVQDHSKEEIKWNNSGFRPPLCTYRLNWARSTSWGWWDEWDDNVLQTQDAKFEPWRSEAEHATSRSPRRLPTILTFTRVWGKNIFASFKPPRPGTEPRTLAWKAAVLTITLGPLPHIKEDNDNLLRLCNTFTK